MAERELEKKNQVISQTIENIDNSLDCTPEEREVEGMWPERLTNTY